MLQIEEMSNRLQKSTQDFVDISVMLNHANTKAFALKIENEKLVARMSELYKVNAQLMKEIGELTHPRKEPRR